MFKPYVLSAKFVYVLMFMLRARIEETKQLARKYARFLIKHLTGGVKIPAMQMAAAHERAAAISLSASFFV